MDSELQRVLETSNRLVVDARADPIWTSEEEIAVTPEDSEVAFQCLPVDVGGWLRVDFITPNADPATWLVYRSSPVEYDLLWPQTVIGTSFKIGTPTQTLGWYEPPGPYQVNRQVIGVVARMLTWFFEEVERRRQYPFLSNPLKDPTKVKNPSKRKKLEEQTNVIVYLGRPPGGTPKNDSDAEKAPREFGYPRRQHRRTLRAERFKNHPKYGVYKGVLVSQSWCGPKEYRDSRKTYRLWEPPAVDTTAASKEN